MKMKIPLEEAQSLLETYCGSAGTERVSLLEAHGRVLAQDITAPINQPPFDRSPLDGYALRAEDSVGASKERPVRLKVIEEVFAGGFPQKEVKERTATRIMTGAPIPKGANCILRQEETLEENGDVLIYSQLKAWDNYCYAGEDMEKGDLVLKKETLLNFAWIGILASLGIKEVLVYKRPKVAVISTGDELSNLGEELTPGKIYNSNLYTIGMRLKELGIEHILLDSAPDEIEKLSLRIKDALSKADFLITTGGVSVGKKDIVKDAIKILGASILFWKVNLQPGTPVLCSQLDGKLIFSLSGNPAAAMVNFEMLVRTALAKYAHRKDLRLIKTEAVLKSPFPKASKNRRFVRGKLILDAEEKLVELPEKHSSGVLSSLLDCNCVVDVPAGTPPLEVGQRVKIFIL
jgi:molybdopterin molybdotransferase